MPTLIQTVNGTVTGLWGSATVRSPDGKLRVLKMGDFVSRGDVILTSQDGIVQLTPEDPPVVTALAEPDFERVIAAIDRPDSDEAPAAGLTAGDGGNLSPGLRVGRISEGVTPAGFNQSYEPTPLTPEVRRNPEDDLVREPGEPAVSISASAISVSEGGSITYTATLTQPVTGSPLVITLSNGQTITVPVGQTTGSTAPSPVRPDDAYGQPAETIVVTVTGTTGSNFTSIDTSTSATTTVTDDTDATTVTLTPSAASVTEGGSIVYTAVVNNPVTGSPLVITLTNGQTITIPVGQSSGVSAPVPVRPDDAYAQGPQTLTVGVGGTTGGNYEALTTTGTASTVVNDDSDATTVTLSASSASVVEGGSVTYTATVSNPVTGTPLSITLSNGLTITIPVGQSSASSAPFAVRADDPYVQGTDTVTVGVSATVGGNFEAISPTFNTVSTSVTDDTDATTVTLTPSAASVTEGGSIVYTATASNPVTGSPLVLTLSNGQTITIPVGQSSGTSAPFPVRPDDANVQGTDTLNVSVTGNTGGNFESVSATGTATTTVTDDTDATTLTLTASSPSVVEGGSIVYTATLGSPVAGTPVVVTLSNGQTITIPVGQSSASSAPVPVRPDDANVQGTETVTVNVTGTAGGTFEALVPANAVSTTVTDDTDTTSLTLTASAPTVVEGGSIVYTATVNNPVAGAPLVITLTNGQTITIPVGQSSASSAPVPVRPDDANLQGTDTVTVGVTGTTGGNFEALAPAAPVSTTVTDDADATTVTLTASATTVNEGGSIVYTATVNNPVTGSPLVVSLANGQTITIPVGQSSASGPAFAVRPDDADVQGTQTVSTSITGTAGGNYEAVTTTGTPATTVTDDADVTTVTLTANTAAVTEGGSIVYTATTNNVVHGTPLVVALSNGQTITIPVGQSSASGPAFPVRADDAYVQGTQTVSASITGTTGGIFESVTTSGTPATTVTDDADVTTLSLTGSTSVAEGGTASYTVSLTSPAQTAVTVNLTYSGTAANGTDFTGVVSVTIPAGASSANFSIATIDDVLAEGAESFTVTLGTASGGNFESLVVSGAAGSVTTGIVDNDISSLSLSATPTLTEAGGTIVYTATLTQPPATALVVTLSNGATITIPAGSLSGTANVPVAPSDDVYVDPSNVSATITGTTGGGIPLSVDPTPAVTSITDTIDTTTVTLTASAPSVAEGGSIVYTATVNNAVTGTPLAVTLSNGQVITIAVGQTTGTSAPVAVRPDDAYAQGSQPVTASITGTTGGNFEALNTGSTVTTNVTDDGDVTTVTLTASAANVTEGGSIVYTASVNNPVAGTPLVVTLANGQTITIPVGQSSASGPAFAVRADDADAQGPQNVSTSITGTTGGNFEAVATAGTPVTVVTDDADVTTVTLTASAASVTEGGSVVYTATVNNVVHGTPLVVTLNNGQTITIPVGQSTANSAPVAVRPDDAYAQGSQPLTASITGTTGGIFEVVNTTSTVTTTVTDDADATTVTLTASAANVTEGGSIVYTATVNNAVTGSPLVVTLNNGQTITIPVGQSTANSAAVPVRADDAYVQGTQPVTASITGTTGGNYEALTTTSSVTTNVTDDADATTVTLTASANSVVEGGSIVYTATASNVVAGTPLVVTLANGQTITIPVGQSSADSAAFPVRADDADAQGNQTVSTSITGATGGNFEAVTTAGTPATTVTDDADVTTVTLTASSASVTEGGSIVYTATTNNVVHGTPLLVTLNNGQVISIAVGQTSGTSAPVAVRPDDAYVQGSQPVTASIASTSGGIFEAINTTSTVTTNVTDDSDATTVTLTASATTVAEGGSIVYTATASNPVTGSALVVTLANGQTITIPVGQSSANSAAFAVRPDDADVQGTQTVSTSITGTAGGNYEAVTTTGTPSTTITDDADVTTVTLTASSASVAEGGSIVYTATTNNVVNGTPLVVTLNNGQVITIPVGQSSANSAPVAVRPDDAYAQGTQPVTASITGTTGGIFEAVNTTSTVTTNVTDDSDATTVTLTASATTVAEGGSIVYTATTSNPVTGSALVVTLANGQTITIPVGQSSANSPAFAVRADDADVQGTQTVSTSITGTTGGNFEAVTTTGTPATTVTDDSDATTVTLTASAPSVVEGGSIVYTATANNIVHGTPLVVTLSNGQQITIPVGQSSASGPAFAVRADDVYVQGTQTVSASITGTTGGIFESVTTSGTPATTVTDDADITTLSLTGSASVPEGGTASYTVSLTSPALTAVTVNLTYTGTAANGADFTGVTSVTIPAGASSATFSIATIDDALSEGAESFTVALGTTSGGNFENLVVSGAAASVTTGIVDNDISTLTLSATPTLTEAGGTIVYTATLTQPPTTALVVTLSNGATITIPAGGLSGTANVPLPASDDVYVDPTSVSATITGTTGGGILLSVDPTPAVTAINDTIDTTTVTLTASSAAVTEGGSIVYTATLNNAVTGSPLVLTLNNGQTITIPVGQTTGTSAAVAVRPDDFYAQGNQNVVAAITGTTGGNFEALNTASTASTTVSDNNSPTTVTLSAAASVAEGGTIVYTATVNHAVQGSPFVVTLNNGQQITIPVGQSSASSAAVPVRADDAYVQGNQNVVASITGTSGGNFETVNTASTASTTVTDDADPTTVTLTAAATVSEGGSIVYTATVNNAVTGSPLVLTLNNGQQITIAVGQTTGTSAAVPVRADDFYAQGNQNVVASVTGSTGGNFEALNTASTATTTVTDNNSPTTVTLTAAASVVEGGSIVYTAAVNHAVTGSPFVVTLNNGQQITIPVGQSSASSAAVPVRADDAYVQGSQNVTASITGTSGGNFEAVTTTSTATTAVTDDSDASVVTLSAAPTVSEGGSIVYTATVSNAVTGSPLVLTLNNGQVITIAVGQTTGSSAAVPVRADDVYAQGNQNVVASITNSSGGNFEALTTTSTATTVVTDNNSPTVVSLSAAASVVEGGSIVYTASVNNAVTGSPFVVTLNNGQQITIPVGQSSANSAAVPVRADDFYVQGSQNVVASITGTAGGNFEAVTTTSTATTAVTDDADASVVTLTAAASVAEGGSIVYTATVDHAVQGSALVVTLNNGQQITIPVGQSTANSAAVPVRADDFYVQGNQSVVASITGTTGGNFEALTTTSTATTTVTDNNSPTTVTLSAAASVVEGGSIVYTATVNHVVAGSPFVVTLNNGQQITIPVGQSSASSAAVPVRADDFYVQGSQNVVASITGTTGGNFEAVTTTSTATTAVTDDADASVVTLSAASTVSEGGSIVYTATVDHAVTGAPLVLTLSNGQNITIAVGQTTGTSAAVPVRADDFYVQGNQNVTASITGSTGGNFEALTITSTATTTVTDNNSPTTVTLSAAASVVEGGSIVYTATVNHAVTGSPFVVTLNNGQQISIPVGQSSANSAAVPVRADDAYVQGNQSVVASITGTSGGNFEAVTSTSTVTTTVTDDSDASVVTLSAPATVAEGGSIVYTATVSNAVTGAPLVLTLNNGQQITIAVGQTSGTSAAVAVRPDDAYAQGNQNLTASITGSTGGNFEALTTTSTATTTVTDNGSATVVTLSAAASVVEGGSIVYTASVNSPVTGSPFVVTLNNGQQITIPVGQSSANSAAVPVRADDAYVQGTQNVVASITGTSGGSFEAVTTTSTATTAVTDDSDASVVTLSAAATVSEGGSIVYTATVSNAVTGAPLVLTLNNGQQITIAVGQTTGTSAAVPVRADDFYVQGNQNVTASITGSTGGNFEALTTTSTATTVVTDNNSPTVVSLSAAASVVEGGTIVYTAAVNHVVAGSPFIVTLNNGQQISIPVGQSSGSSAAVPVRADDVYVQGSQNVVASITGTTGGNFEAVTTTSTATTAVTDDADASVVTLSAAATVSEGGSIVYTATVSNAVTGAPLVLTLNNGQTISIAVGQTTGTSVAVPVRADDFYVQGNQNVTASITGSTGGNFEALTTTSTATTVVTDNNSPTVVSLSAAASVVEGGTIVYTAAVNHVVAGSPFVVTLNNGQQISIPVGQSSATSAAVAVRADDFYVQGSQNVVASITGTSGGNFEAVTTTSTATTAVTDDADASVVTLTATPTVVEGGSIVYTATVDHAVQGSALVVTLSNSQTITIPVGQTSGTSVAVPVRADDVYAQGNQNVVASITGTTGGNFEALTTTSTATTVVTDDADVTTVSITGSASVTEGGTGAYTVTLSSPALTAVTVSLNYTGTATNGADYTGVATVTIPAGSSSATFNLNTIDDTRDEPNETIVIAVGTITGGGFEAIAAHPTNGSFTTTLVDNDPTPTLSINDVTVNEAAGTATFTVTLSAASNQAVSVTYNTSNGTATAGSDYTAASGTLNFAAGVTTQTITVAITNDTLTELSETFNVNLLNPVNATISDALGVGTIIDNDAPPVIDLDGNNSSGATGANYTVTFTENQPGAGVSIADTDISITDVDSANLTGATIVLTNRQAGDALNLGTDVPGISINAVSTGTTVTLTLTGSANLAAYMQRIQNVTFTNNSEDPSATPRIITVQVTDGTSNSNVATTTVNVIPVNDAPEGRDVTVTTAEDVPYVFGLGNFLMNDAEQGTNVNPNFVRIDTLPTNGSLYLNGTLVTIGQVLTAAQISGGQLSFVPGLDESGANYARLTFSVGDNASTFDAMPNTVTVNVTMVNDGPPVAANDAFQTTLGTPIVITQAQLLGNDLLRDHARITNVSSIPGLVDNLNGTYTYTPSATGNASFTYTLTDDDNQTSTATVTVNTVAARDDLATVYESALSTGSGGGSTIATGNLMANDGGGTSITSVNGITDGSANDTDSRAGYIGVTTALGKLVVDSSGTGAGDYTYTLNTNANNSAAANNLSVSENFTYVSNATSATLRVTVVDDLPQVHDREIQVSQVPLPSYNLVLVLDISGSMTTAQYGGAVRQVNADGTTTVTTRLAMAKEALIQLVEQYYNQAQNVNIKLITFSDSATTLNGGAAYTDKAATIAAINGIAGTAQGGTNYQAGLVAAQAAFGTVDTTKNNATYFLSDGEPNGGNTATGTTTYNNFATANGVDTYAVGIGTGIANTSYLTSIHNVDADGNGVRDSAIIVPDLNQLGSALLSTVPPAYGGNVVSAGTIGSAGSMLGADGGYIQTVTLRLDSDGNGTPDTDVTFSYNNATNTITQNSAFLTGYPKAGTDVITLNSSSGFTLGSLTFNFSTGSYTYYTNGTAAEGDNFTLRFVARDGDGDVTPSTSLRFEIANGAPVARPDTDTLQQNETHLEGNVITALGTDGGLALGQQVATFAAQGSGVDTAVDNAKVTSIDFQGVHYNLLVNGSGSGAGYTYTIANGQITWTGSGVNAGQKLVFATSGYYDYTPPTAALTATPTAAAVTTSFTTAALSVANGVSLVGYSRTGVVQALNYVNTGNADTRGVGVTNGGSAALDNLERLVVNFSSTSHPYGVQGVTLLIAAAASNLGASGGTVSALTYTVYDVSGAKIGQFYSTAEGNVSVPAELGNIGSIEIEANSPASARVTSVSFSHVNLDTAAPAVAPVEVGYTLTDDDGSSSSSSLTLKVISNNIFGNDGDNLLDGTSANDRILGGAGNDTINGGAGHDVLEGGLGNDIINGGAGNDILRGGQGNDTLDGGTGNDIIHGGQGNDSLTGGDGSDVFRWEFADQGVHGAPAIDTVNDFNNAAASNGGDVLDLRDLLQGETLSGAATGNLTSYLHFDVSGGTTTIQISSNGGFSGGYNAGAVDQSIRLTGVDLSSAGSFNTDQQIIQDLLNKSKLVVDGGL